MRVRRIVRLRPGMRVEFEQSGALAVLGSGYRVQLRELGEELKAELPRLTGFGLELDEFIEGSSGHLEPVGIASRMVLLRNLSSLGLLRYGLSIDGTMFAEVEPLNRRFEWCSQEDHETTLYAICSFSILRRDLDAWLLEAPLQHVRARLLRAECLDMLNRLSRPTSLKELLVVLPSIRPAVIRHVFAFLLDAGVIHRCQSDERSAGSWTFEDFFFHYHTRLGFKGDPLGATGASKVLKRKNLLSSRSIKLGPAGSGKESSLASVLSRRRSRRDHGRRPITIDQLATFFLLSARGTPSPRMGGLDAFEFYIAVGRCNGLPPGFYRYCPTDHAMEPLAASADYLDQTLGQASSALGTSNSLPDVVIKLVVDIERVSRAYDRIAYRLALLNAGMIMQTMYLVATELCLAPCAIGSGDSLDFASQVDIDSLQQDVVAELALSSTEEVT